MKFLRRTSSESIPSSWASCSTIISIRWVASGPARAAGRVRGHLVGEDAAGGELQVRDLVTARDHEARERRDERRQQREVGAEVADRGALEADDRAVALGADLHVVDLVAPVDRGAHVLRARLGPLDRAADLARDPRRDDLLGEVRDLHAEAAADVGRDHADPVLAHLQLARHEEADQVRVLAREVQRELVAAVVGDAHARLDRGAGRAVVDDPPLDDDLGLGPRLVHVAAADRPLVDLVGPELRVDERGAVLERLLGVDDHGQRVVVDEHLLGRVDDRVLVLADHDGDALADVLDLVLGQRPVLGGLDLDARRHPRHRQRRRRDRGRRP